MKLPASSSQTAKAGASDEDESGGVTCNDFSRYAVNRVANFGSIVGDSAIYPIDSIATRYQARFDAYLAMKHDSTIIYQFDSLDTYFENFYLTLDTSNVGRFSRVIEIAETDSDSAANLNSAIIAIGETETLLKSFYTLYFHKILAGDTLNSTDSTDLQYIAMLSPSAYGQIVHKAASAIFLEVHPDEFPLRQGNLNSKSNLNETLNPSKPELFIYPNPSKDNITLVSTIEMRVIEIFNPSGSLLIKENLNAKSKKVDLNTVPAGIYYARTILFSGDILISKFIIQK